MARLEHIRYEFADASLSEDGGLIWSKQAREPIDALPQIFWKDGRGWDEANVWALDRVASDGVKLETAERVMQHLHRYAKFTEGLSIDWRHFPVRKEEQVLRKFRKALIDEMASGMLAGGTAASCMRAVTQFYRFADNNGLVGAHSPMWQDHMAVIPFYDATGFKRSVARLTNDLRIPNRERIGPRLEDGLLPLRAKHMQELLAYTAKREIKELHLMLAIGFFTGARIGTITTLTVTSLETAREDPTTPGVFLLAVGPGSSISTKFSVSGALLVPRAVLDDLRRYATSTQRLMRQIKALREHKGLLFLTRQGKPYGANSANRLTQAMRGRAVKDGLQFMHRFRFHQSRATFGTWLMKLLLDAGITTTNAIQFVRDAMLHKDERTTMLYITFLENSRGKEQLAVAFNEAFTGLRDRNWDTANV